MKNIKILVLLICLGIAGCETTAYYTDPASPGYNQQALGCICELCGRVFNISGNQLNNTPNILCPYCGRSQNTVMASNRYTYAVQQQQQQQYSQALAGIAQAQAQGAQNNVNTLNAYINRPKTNITCRDYGGGTVRCNSD